MSFRDKVLRAFRLLLLPTVMISRKLRGSLAEKNVIRVRTLRKVKEVEAALIAGSIRLFQGTVTRSAARQFRFSWILRACAPNNLLHAICDLILGNDCP